MHTHETEITPSSVAQLLSNTLYGRRFFPYYAFNVLAGIDEEGKGAVFTYDAVGSFERVQYACQGSGQKLIIPYLDNVVGFRTRSDDKPEFTPDDAVNIAKDAFITATERQIYVGDKIKIFVIVAGVDVEESEFELKRD
jgi:20S proteasome subunit beta 6